MSDIIPTMFIRRPVCAALAAMAITPLPAKACRVATRWHVPSEVPSDAVVEGVVASIDTSDEYRRAANVRITKRWLGNEKPEMVQLTWSLDGGMCGPPGPIPQENQRLLVYLKKQNEKLRPIGWSVIDKEPDGSVIRQRNKEAKARVN